MSNATKNTKATNTNTNTNTKEANTMPTPKKAAPKAAPSKPSFTKKQFSELAEQKAELAKGIDAIDKVSERNKWIAASNARTASTYFALIGVQPAKVINFMAHPDKCKRNNASKALTMVYSAMENKSVAKAAAELKTRCKGVLQTSNVADLVACLKATKYNNGENVFISQGQLQRELGNDTPVQSSELLKALWYITGRPLVGKGADRMFKAPCDNEFIKSLLAAN